MKKTILILAILVLGGFGFYTYITRPVPVPTKSVQMATDTLKPMSTVTSLYRISQDNSKAEFQINELLYGKPKLVIGTTTQVAGDIAVTNSHIDMGPMKIDARTFITDSEKRNGALNRMILKTDKAGNEYITFQPLSNDFTGTLTFDQSVTFNVIGDLTISGVTKQATFKVTAMFGADKITGTAETKIKRSDFGLVIPNFPFLANVDEDVTVTVDVMANKVAQ